VSNKNKTSPVSLGESDDVDVGDHGGIVQTGKRTEGEQPGKRKRRKAIKPKGKEENKEATTVCPCTKERERPVPTMRYLAPEPTTQSSYRPAPSNLPAETAERTPPPPALTKKGSKKNKFKTMKTTTKPEPKPLTTATTSSSTTASSNDAIWKLLDVYYSVKQ